MEKDVVSAPKSFYELLAIADQIEAREDAWRKAWAAFDAPAAEPSGSQLMEAVSKATLELNQFIDGKAQAIAEITGNHVSNVRMGFAPREPLDVWFGGRPDMPASAFLRKVAQHMSFNTEYWSRRELAAERDAFLAKVAPEAVPVDVMAAVVAMESGEVPVVDAKVAMRLYGSLSELEREMLRAGILERYDGTHADRVSATVSVAFVLSDDSDQRTFVYWPRGVAVNRCERIVLDDQTLAQEESGAGHALRQRGAGCER